MLFALLTFASGEVSAQRAQLMLDELPSIPFDTLSAENGRRIIITSNGTWRYLNEDIAELKNNKLFYNHWDTASVFAYRDFDYDKMLTYYTDYDSDEANQAVAQLMYACAVRLVTVERR